MAKNRGGRPKKRIDFELVDRLCAIQCTGEEIASVLNVSYDTLERRVKEKFGVSFADYFEEKRGKGRVSLRRMQWKKAEKGDTTMLIWLGKQYLKQTDKQEVDQTGQMGLVVLDDLSDE